MAAFKSVALIPAAGMGRRMGASINKQYLLLHGMPIVARTIAAFEQSTLIEAIYLVVPAEEIPYCREHVVNAYGFSKVVEIVPGGTERQNSVLNGLNAMKNSISADDVVLIHDGVRPFISEEMLREAITSARSNDGAVVAVPVKDTIKTVENGRITVTPARDTLWQAQTPQVFRFDLIHAAYLKAEADRFMGTDDSSLVERIGGRVSIIRGDYRNIKITTPEDLVLAEAFLASAASERNGYDKKDH